LAWLSRKIAKNHVVCGSLVLANKVPAVIDVCTWHALHWKRRRDPLPTMQ